jgi:hypothetical protein
MPPPGALRLLEGGAEDPRGALPRRRPSESPYTANSGRMTLGFSCQTYV